MTVKELIAVMFACVLADNCLFQTFLGTEAVAEDSKGTIKSVLNNGLKVTAVLVVSSFLTAVAGKLLSANAAYLQTLVFAVIILAVTSVASIVAKKISPEGKFQVLPVAFNSAVLGVCLLNTVKAYSIGVSVAVAFASGAGYLVAALVVAGVRERINEKYVPSAWRGFPILVAAMGIISLVLFAF